jgi:sugar phosphate isomerase/epimerase
MPGDGDIDLVSIVRVLGELGATAPIGVEIFSTELARLPAIDVARKAGDRLRAVLSRARASTTHVSPISN